MGMLEIFDLLEKQGHPLGGLRLPISRARVLPALEVHLAAFAVTLNNVFDTKAEPFLVQVKSYPQSWN